MNIISIMLNTPTCDNRGAASALPFHLLKCRPDGVEVILYTFNLNDVGEDEIARIEQDLNVKINGLSLPWWFKLAATNKALPIRALLSFPFQYYVRLSNSVISEIHALKPDCVWLYPEEKYC